jgi:hypothetical protein
LAHRIFGVGHTFTNVRELLRSARATSAPAARRHFSVRVCDPADIFAEYVTRAAAGLVTGWIDGSASAPKICTVSSKKKSIENARENVRGNATVPQPGDLVRRSSEVVDN